MLLTSPSARPILTHIKILVLFLLPLGAHFLGAHFICDFSLYVMILV